MTREQYDMQGMRDQYVRPFGVMSSEPIQHSQDNQCFQGCGLHRVQGQLAQSRRNYDEEQ
jgi:hypothetical protein